MKRIWQKAKKATAFLLAVMLIAAMCPMSFAAEAEDNTWSFNFYDTKTTSERYWTYKYPTSMKENTPPSGDASTGLRASWELGSTTVPAYTADTLRAVAYRFTSAVSGTFTPSLSYTKTSYSGIMRAYCVSKKEFAEVKSEDDPDSTDDNIFGDWVKKHLSPEVAGIGKIDFADATGATGTKLDAVTLKAGEVYYFVFILDGESSNRTNTKKYTYANHNFKTMAFTRVNDGSTAAPTTLSYIVRADERTNDSKVTVSDDNYTVNGTNVGSWTVDTSFTATAKGDDFAYWANGNGTPVSESPIYTFTPTSNFTLEAVYAPADTATKKVQFWNYNKVYLDEVTAGGDTLGDDMPANPTLNGWSFTGWKTDADKKFDAATVITDAITRVVAQFTKKSAPFTIDGASYSYDAPFTKTADAAPEGQVFSHWTINDQVASYAETLSFNVWNTVNVAAVYADTAPEALPTVVLDKVNADEYFIAYEVPTGYTPVDAGIVFGASGSTPRVDSSESKANVKQAGAKGQFTAAPGDDTHTAARGYVMYKDSADNYRIIYSAVK